MNSSDTFSTYNPIINFTFYIGAIVCGMFFIHPAFLACAVIFSISYYLTIKGVSGIKTVLGLFPLWLVLVCINPIFNTKGTHVLFTYLNDRLYTMEALCYGMAIASMFIAIIVWFLSYNAVMTSDKFVYIFGRLIPATSLIFTMVLRLVPNYRKKIIQIANARKCIGKGMDSGGKKQRAEDGLMILSALAGWAFEGGIITADSMRARGYGVSKRTSFSIYSFKARDRLLFIAMLLLLIIVFICSMKNGTATEYIPEIQIMNNNYTIIGTVAYSIFLSIPTVLNLMEALTWHILRSKI